MARCKHEAESEPLLQLSPTLTQEDELHQSPTLRQSQLDHDNLDSASSPFSEISSSAHLDENKTCEKMSDSSNELPKTSTRVQTRSEETVQPLDNITRNPGPLVLVNEDGLLLQYGWSRDEFLRYVGPKANFRAADDGFLLQYGWSRDEFLRHVGPKASFGAAEDEFLLQYGWSRDEFLRHVGPKANFRAAEDGFLLQYGWSRDEFLRHVGGRANFRGSTSTTHLRYLLGITIFLMVLCVTMAYFMITRAS